MSPFFSVLKKRGHVKRNTLYNLTSYKSCWGDFLPFQHPDFVLQGVLLAPKSFLVDDLDCVHLPILLWLCQPHLWKRAPEKKSCVIFCGVVKFCENVPLKTHLCFVASSCFVFGQRRYIRWWDYNYQAGPQIGTIDAEKASWCITTLGILWPNGRPYLAPFEKMQTCGLFQNVHLQLLGHENCEKPSHKQKMPKPALFPCPFLPFSGNISFLQKKKSLQTLPLDCSKDWETEITALCEPDMGTRALLEPGTQLTCIWESSLTSILREKCKSKWETETGCRRWSFPG